MKKLGKLFLSLICGIALAASFTGCDIFGDIILGDVGYLQVCADNENYEDCQIHVRIYRAAATGSGSYTKQEKVWDSLNTEYKLGLAELDEINMEDYLTPNEYYIIEAAYKKEYKIAIGEFTSTEYKTLKCKDGGKTAYPAQAGKNLKIHMGEKSAYQAGSYLYYEWVYDPNKYYY